MTWTDVSDDPSDTWTDVTDPPYRHTYGKEYGTDHRIRFGDHVRIGGLGWEIVSDPSSTWTDADDPA